MTEPREIIEAQTVTTDLAKTYGMTAEAFVNTVRSVSFGKETPSPGELLSCFIVAREHKLNPLTKEIYFMRTKSGQIQPIVGVDGWIRKCNDHPQFDGIEFAEEVDEKKALVSVTCTIHRKDRKHPMKITEYLSECKGNTPPWQKTPRRMMRHRALIQCSRIAFGFAGVMERDEFDQWQDEEKPINITTQAVPMDIPDIPETPTEPDKTEAAPNVEEAETIEPLADEEGFIAKFQDQIDETGGLPNLIDEVEEENADLFARLSPARQAQISEILESARA